MSAENLTIDRLCKSPLNVRTNEEDSNATDAIAASILTRHQRGVPGLIHALVVHPLRGSQGKKLRYGVIAGARRYLAIKRLIESGDLPATWPISVTVSDLSDAELVELSHMENLLRRSLRPYEEFAAIARQHAKGTPAKDIAAHFGQTLRWVQQSLRLAGLAPEIFDAFKNGRLSLDQAKAYAATEDHAVQRHAWAQLSEQKDWNHRPSDIRGAMNVGNRDAMKLLRFVGESAYRDAGGRFELDLFADEAEHRGLVADEGILHGLVAARLESMREEARRRAGRDIRFVKAPPTNDYGVVDRGLEIHPALTALDDFDETELREIRAEQSLLEAQARELLDPDTRDPLPGKQGAIDAIDTRWTPNERRIAEIEGNRRLVLPDGDIVATITIGEDGTAELEWWWPDRKALTAASMPDRKKAIAARPTPPAAAVDRDLGPGAAFGEYAYRDRTAADQIARTDFGLTQDGVDTLRSIRRANLRALLVDDARADGTIGRDYLTWAQLRMLITGDRPEQLGVRRVIGGDIDSKDAAALLLDQGAQRAFDSCLADLAVLPSMTLTDLTAAFRSFRAEPERTRNLAAAAIVGLTIERSLNAPGYQLPVHDTLAAATIGASDFGLRAAYWEPTAGVLDLFSKAHRLEIAENLVDRETLLRLSKAKSAELTASVLTIVQKATTWVHPLLRFAAPAEAQPAPSATAQSADAAVAVTGRVQLTESTS